MGLAEQKDFFNRLGFCTNLPSPPGVAIKIIELNKQPDISINDVVDTIKLDPALSAKMIRMANSPLYARRHKTENLRQAIIHFGPYNALTLALSFSLTRNLASQDQNHLDYPLFWRRSLASAMACQMIGETFTSEESDEFFLAGLIQDIGMLVMDSCGDKGVYLGTDSLQHDHAALCRHEIERLGIDHAVIGAWMLGSWNFPESLINTIRGSHDPDNEEIDSDYRLYARVAFVGNAVAEILCHDDISESVAMAAERASQYLDISQEKLTPIIDKLIRDITVIADLFEIDIGNSAFLASITDQANEMLMLRNMESINEARELKQINRSLKIQTVELEQEKRRDHLTQAYNRRHLDEVLAYVFGQTKEMSGNLSVAFIDIDHFKQINDQYGHQTGDEALKAVSEILKAEVRGNDQVFRYGGEEFVLLLVNTGHMEAVSVCNRLLDVFRTTPFTVSNNIELSLRVSIGVSTMEEGSGFNAADDMIRAADKAVYAAKFGGRDKIVYYGFDIQ